MARWRAARRVDQCRGFRAEPGYARHNFLGDPFLKGGPNKSLGRIDHGPFYAVNVVPGDVGTYGGIVTDVSSRVGRVYPGAGASVGPSMVFGYIAAKRAAGVSGQA